MRTLLYTLLAITISACASQKGANTTVAPAKADSTCTFATHLFKAVSQTAQEENYCISPASAMWALSMTANGATGTTAQEIYSAMGYPLASDEREAYNSLQRSTIDALRGSEHAQVKVANSIWAANDIEIKKAFTTDNGNHYDATVKNVIFDEATEKEINSWCGRNTEGKITSIVNNLPPDTKMLLVNALYFKAHWAHPFTKEATYKAPFTKADGTIVEVDMMRQSRFATYYEDSTMQATIKPFERGEYSMLLILPKEGFTTTDVADKLASSYHTNLFKGKEYMLDLHMPKFKSEYGTSLKPMLESIGIKRAFTSRAEFDGISKRPLLIDDVIQKSYIAVDETGAEAAAVTAVQMALTGLRPQERKSLTLNRPFIYAITHNQTGEILFIGKVGNPVKK